MEIEQTYIAKDGMRFKDPIKCQDYEKNLGVLRGSIGEMVLTLEKLPASDFVQAMVVTKESKGTCLLVFHTTDCKGMLEDFVNPENLTEEQCYYSETVCDMIKVLKRHEQDAPCQYMVFWCKSRMFVSCRYAASYNADVWDKE